jgi:NAD(P)-dependent dehydrogenase (short-subunit alcohol dehydrogenase family)
VEWTRPGAVDDGATPGGGTRMRLEGHVALVTGANRNIGRASALELASRGCAVIVNASRSRQEAEAVAAEARTHGVKAAALLADVGRADDVKALARQAVVSGQMIGVNGGAST